MITSKKNPTRIYYDNLPQLPIEERDRRWNAIRKYMQQEGIDCLLSIGNDLTFGLGMGNFRYLSNCAPRHGGFLIFPLKGEPVMFAEQYHMSRPIHPCYLAHDWVKDCRFNNGIGTALDTLQEMVSPLKKVGLVSGANTVQYQNMPSDIFAAIKTRMDKAGVEIVDVSKFLFEMRGQKSDIEIEFLRRAGKIHNKTLLALIDAAGEGVTEAEVFARMEYEQLTQGAEFQGFNLLTSGPTSAPEYQHMLHGLDVDMCPTMRKLEKGDAIIAETHVSYAGYMTASEFTLCIGQPPKEYEKLFYAMVEAFHAGLEQMKPGNTVGMVLDAERAVVDKYGYGILELGIHGHGLGSPEPPKAIFMNNDESLCPENKKVTAEQRNTIIKKNMVFGTNGDIFDNAWRDDVGVMFGDCVVIGNNGPELLVNTPQKLYVK